MLTDIIIVGAIALGVAITQSRLHGPFGVSEFIRNTVGESKTLPAWIVAGVSCAFCVSFWGAALGALLVGSLGSSGADMGTLGDFLTLWLGGFGVACFALIYTGH